MAKWTVELSDGRTLDAYAPDEAGAISQADHHERDRFIIAIKRSQEPGPSPSRGVSAVKIKD